MVLGKGSRATTSHHPTPFTLSEARAPRRLRKRHHATYLDQVSLLPTQLSCTSSTTGLCRAQHTYLQPLNEPLLNGSGRSLFTEQLVFPAHDRPAANRDALNVTDELRLYLLQTEDAVSCALRTEPTHCLHNVVSRMLKPSHCSC